MNRIPSESELRHYRCRYPAGTRIQLDADMDDPQPISAGTKGTIIAIDDMAQALMKWDNGRSLSLVLYVDKFHKLQLENNEKLVGHSINGNRNLRSINDVAEFIMWHGKYGDVEITTEFGEPFIRTEGTHIKYVSDKEDITSGIIRINKTAEDGIVGDREFKISWTENGVEHTKNAVTNANGVAIFDGLHVYDFGSKSAISYNIAEINIRAT